MRLWDNKIGEKIIEIVYEHEPKGIGFRELWRKIGHTKTTLDRWLIRLRTFKIIKQTPRFPIHLTEAAIQKYRQNSLLIPFDVRQKITVKEKHIFSEKERRSIILVLSLMALGVYKPVKYHKTKAGLLEMHNPSNSTQFFMYGGKTIHSVSLYDIVSRIRTKNPDSPNKRAFLPETKINYGNNELFGYLNLTLEEVNRIFDKLLDHNPPIIKPLKIKGKTKSEIRYTIADDLLKEFVTNCILYFNVHVNDRLQYAYIYDLFHVTEKENGNFLKKGEQIKKYKKYMQIWYGSKRKTCGFFSMMYMRKELSIKNNEKLELAKHYKKVINEWDKIIKDIHLFDNKFENVHEKYKPLYDKYGFIVNIFLELLFPKFLREIWKRKNAIT